jgi:hypothetical protein
MDWTNRSTLTTWFIAVLLVVNIISVSIICIQTDRKKEPPKREQKELQAESVTLMKQALSLTDDQTKRFEDMRRGQLDKSKAVNDQMSELKVQLVNGLFNEKSDSTLVHTIAQRIGTLQTELETIRYYHFKEFLGMCTPEQKTAFRPIVMNLFGRKPQKDNTRVEVKERNDRVPPEGDRPRDDETQKRRPDEQSPPSLEEKLQRYDKRLQLSVQQREKVLSIFEATMEQMNRLKETMKPDQEEFAQKKDTILENEDRSIMSVLNEAQKREFVKMQQTKRRK